MAFQIEVRKPAGREAEGNRQWANAVARLPGFTIEELDPATLAELAKDAAENVGLTPDEYVHRAIGLTVTYEAQDLWCNVEFWTSVATVELPNFPACGVRTALLTVAPVLQVLRALGFVPLDPTTDEPLTDDRAELTQAYNTRQALVHEVAELTEGKPG